MPVGLDTNALLGESSPPAELVARCRQGRLTLLTADPQLNELARVTRYPKIRARLKPALAGRLVNDVHEIAEIVEQLPTIDASPDPYDNYLLSIVASGDADYPMTGDKSHLLALDSHGGTKVVSVPSFLALTGRLQ